jgi:hypothetical protein
MKVTIRLFSSCYSSRLIYLVSQVESDDLSPPEFYLQEIMARVDNQETLAAVLRYILGAIY